MSLFDQKYEELIKEFTLADVGMGSSGTEGSLNNGDSYASGDMRMPKSIFGGAIQTRAGSVKGSKKKKKKKKKAKGSKKKK